MGFNRRPFATVVVALLVVTTGCVTVSPAIESSGGSGVFESISTTNEWGSSSVMATVTLTPAATTSMGVTRLNIITDSGEWHCLVKPV